MHEAAKTSRLRCVFWMTGCIVEHTAARRPQRTRTWRAPRLSLLGSFIISVCVMFPLAPNRFRTQRLIFATSRSLSLPPRVPCDVVFAISRCSGPSSCLYLSTLRARAKQRKWCSRPVLGMTDCDLRPFISVASASERSELAYF